MQTKTEAEWKSRGDSVEAYPFVVVYKDKRTFPASWYYKTLDEAKADQRPADHIMERRYDEKGYEVARLVRRAEGR